MDRATFESLAGGLRKFAPVSDAALEGLRAITHAKQFAANGYLLRAGERAEQCFFLTAGLVREFYLDERGQEHNRSFLAAGDITGSLLDLLSGRPAVTYIQALESSATLCWDYARFDRLCARFGELQLVARRFTERLYVRKAQREHEMLALNARARLAQWLRDEAALDARVSRRHLASYLGITPEHLSRLRRAATAPRAARAARRRSSPR